MCLHEITWARNQITVWIKDSEQLCLSMLFIGIALPQTYLKQFRHKWLLCTDSSEQKMLSYVQHDKI